MKTRAEVIQMYIDWTIGADEDIHMDDWLIAAWDAGLDDEEIEIEGSKIIKERGL